MKHFYIKCILLCLLTFISISVLAYDCEVDGIYYNLNKENNSASVTFKSQYGDSYEGMVDIPSSILYEGTTYSVTKIDTKAFYGCYWLNSVTIPNSVVAIGSEAFHLCWDLTSIQIPNSVTSIDKEAFANCRGLLSMTIPNSVTAIRDGVFCDCSSLTSITIPNSVKSIGDDAFSGCI